MIALSKAVACGEVEDGGNEGDDADYDVEDVEH
jgi:hypothetical protein